MLKGDWLRHPATGVAAFLLLGLGGTALQPHKYESGGPYHAAQQQLSDSRERAAPVKATIANPNPDRDEWREERDLDAQRDMARWAFLMLFVSGAGVVVTAAGVIFVARTLRATVAMVEQTALANAAAMKGAEATERAVKLERPWLVVEKIDKVDGSGRANGRPFEGSIFTFIWKNAGRTPATNIQIWSGYQTHAPGQDPNLFSKDSLDKRPTPPVAPGGTFGAGPVVVPKQKMDALYQRQITAFLWCRLEYEVPTDAGSVRHTQVCFEVLYHGDMGPEGGKMNRVLAFRPAGDQNDGD